eukprot:gene8503-7772_t
MFVATLTLAVHAASAQPDPSPKAFIGLYTGAPGTPSPSESLHMYSVSPKGQLTMVTSIDAGTNVSWVT